MRLCRLSIENESFFLLAGHNVQFVDCVTKFHWKNLISISNYNHDRINNDVFFRQVALFTNKGISQLLLFVVFDEEKVQLNITFAEFIICDWHRNCIFYRFAVHLVCVSKQKAKTINRKSKLSKWKFSNKKHKCSFKWIDFIGKRGDNWKMATRTVDRWNPWKSSNADE